jgi:transitional endoplasmic reticulum ATPase
MLCILSKLDPIDLEDETMDVENLDAMKVAVTNFRIVLKNTNPSTLRETVIEVSDIKWEDIGSLENIKQKLREAVQYALQFPELFSKFKLDCYRRFLFYGNPLYGKTLLAKAVTSKCSGNFISIKGSELLSMQFGESESNVGNIFDKAPQASACILFFDELNSIVKARCFHPGNADAADREINQLLSEVDGLEPKKTVFTIGSTNRPDIIDPVIIRPNRLNQFVYIPIPDELARVAIFQARMRKFNVSPNVNFSTIAHATNDFSGADITEICIIAIRNTLNRSHQVHVQNSQKSRG